MVKPPSARSFSLSSSTFSKLPAFVSQRNLSANDCRHSAVLCRLPKPSWSHRLDHARSSRQVSERFLFSASTGQQSTGQRWSSCHQSAFYYGGGLYVNFSDIAGPFSGVLFGISNTIASVSGVISPYLVGILTPSVSLWSAWVIGPTGSHPLSLVSFTHSILARNGASCS